MNKSLLSWLPAILFVLLGFLAFGIQAFWLGYYLDDWVVIYHIFRGGYERLVDYSFAVNRPYGAWPWWIGYSLVDYSPFGWQIWSLIWRLITVILLWLGWRRIFPDKSHEITLASGLFLVYPIFVQQTAAVTFSDHWMCFALYALSIFLMVEALYKPGLYWVYTGLALAASGLQLFAIEYFVGLELIRPLLLWHRFRDIEAHITRLKKTILHELPYGIVLGGFLAWRFFLMPTLGADRNRPELLVNLVQKPFQTLASFSIEALQDVVEALFGAWYKTYNPSTITTSPPAQILGWGVGVAALGLCLLVWLYFLREDSLSNGKSNSTKGWIILNLLTMLAGLLPGWVVGAQLVTVANYSDRFGLAAMFGASLVLVSLTGAWINRRRQIILISILIALAVGYHFRLSNEYRWRWEAQSRLAWQLAWRFPGLKPGTAIYGDGVLSSGSWVDIAWVNFLFSTPGVRNGDDYWYYDLNKFRSGNIPSTDVKLSEKRMENFSFQGNTSDSLVIQFKTVPNQCLWVIDPKEPNPFLNPIIEETRHLSNLERIQINGTSNPNIKKIFIPESSGSWCYYYQKAQLAIQSKRWDTVKILWQELSNNRIKTNVLIEYLPFIHGLGMSGEIESAIQLSQRLIDTNPQLQEPVCLTWKKIQDGGLNRDNVDFSQTRIKETIQCTEF